MRSFQGFALLAAAIAFTDAQKIDATAMVLNISSTAGETTIPYQYGVMFEDINHSGDGGIYAELIQNRAFQALSFEQASIDPWFGVGGSVLSLKEINWLSIALPFYVNVAPPSGASSPVGLANPGWWGISVTPQTYTGSFYVMGAYNGEFTISLGSNLTSQVFATTSVAAKSKSEKWTQVSYTLTPSAAAPNSNNTLSVTFDPIKATDGSLNFNLLSLFPETYNNRPNGNRKELMQALADLTPSYFRMPGGNNIEGINPDTSTRWIWNQTIGPLIDRPGRLGTWGYYNTDGLGLAEYMDWAVDLDMEPVLAVWSGLYLDGTIIPEAELEPYIQDALNEIEYIVGNTSTPMGALRASHGRAKPWKLNWVEIGNEDFLNGGTDSYINYRYPMFYNAITAAYPDITTFASFTNFPQAPGAYNDYHIYTRPDDFVGRYHQSDYASSVNPAMVGEYACIQNNTEAGGGADFSQPLNLWPFWEGSVSEVVYLLGLEVNAATIFGASYAPTLQNLNSFEWNTNMISFQADPSKTVLSTSWHTVNLLSGTRFTSTRKVTATKGNVPVAAGPLYWAAGVNEDTGSNILKAAVYNSTNFESIPVAVYFPGVKKGAVANLTVLTAPDAVDHAYVGYDPVTTTTTMLTAGDNGVFTFGLPNLSVAVLATMPKKGSGTTGAATGFKGFGGYGGCKGGKAKTSVGNGC